MIKHYYKMKNWTMVLRGIELHVKLFLRAKCVCPFDRKGHKVKLIHHSRTAYHWNEKGIDPNGPWLCCKKLADYDREYWDDRWSEYYSSVL